MGSGPMVFSEAANLPEGSVESPVQAVGRTDVHTDAVLLVPGATAEKSKMSKTAKNAKMEHHSKNKKKFIYLHCAVSYDSS